MTDKTKQNVYDFSNQTAVITGGAGVLCATMCRALAIAGAKVAVLDLKSDAVEALAVEIRANHGEAIGIACDVLDEASIHYRLWACGYFDQRRRGQ
jgi:NAD(P)-dependent dehydrogenase (short-subunit alcohol dehydrogenase family)